MQVLNVPVAVLVPSPMVAAGTVITTPEQVKAVHGAPGSASVVPPIGVVAQVGQPTPDNGSVPGPVPVSWPPRIGEPAAQYDGGFSPGRWADVDGLAGGEWPDS